MKSAPSVNSNGTMGITPTSSATLNVNRYTRNVGNKYHQRFFSGKTAITDKTQAKLDEKSIYDRKLQCKRPLADY